jgi:hypothetical protein
MSSAEHSLKRSLSFHFSVNIQADDGCFGKAERKAYLFYAHALINTKPELTSVSPSSLNWDNDRSALDTRGYLIAC